MERRNAVGKVACIDKPFRCYLAVFERIKKDTETIQ